MAEGQLWVTGSVGPTSSTLFLLFFSLYSLLLLQKPLLERSENFSSFQLNWDLKLLGLSEISCNLAKEG